MNEDIDRFVEGMHLDSIRESEEDCSELPQVPCSAGRWRHSNGMLFMGTLRVAKTDFDTDPCEEYQNQLLDDMVEKLNS